MGSFPEGQALGPGRCRYIVAVLKEVRGGVMVGAEFLLFLWNVSQVVIR